LLIHQIAASDATENGPSAKTKTPDITISVKIGGLHRAVAVGFELENRPFATCGDARIPCHSNESHHSDVSESR
jgi:hypothetical protein